MKWENVKMKFTVVQDKDMVEHGCAYSTQTPIFINDVLCGIANNVSMNDNTIEVECLIWDKLVDIELEFNQDFICNSMALKIKPKPKEGEHCGDI